jgi:hypothetical protein
MDWDGHWMYKAVDATDDRAISAAALETFR